MAKTCMIHHSIFAFKDVGVAAGDDHSMALLKQQMWTWGRGEHGQLGQKGRLLYPNEKPYPF